MEKRKCQIQNKVHEVTEETNLLKSYLDLIIDQVHACADLLNGSKNVKPKDHTFVLKHQLEILKKITEMNLELECIIEQNPLDQLKAAVYEDYSSVVVKPVKSEVETSLGAVEKQEPVEPLLLSKLSNVACSSTQYSDIRSEIRNAEIETQSNLSDAEIHIIRDTLRKYSEKLGLNSECISSLEDIYQKPSTSCTTEYYDNSSSSQYKIDSANTDLGNNASNGFDIPEKDTNKSLPSKSELENNCYDILQSVESSISLEQFDTVNSSVHAVHDIDLIKSVQEIKPKVCESEEVCTANGNSSDSSENMTERSLSEECVIDEANHCPKPLVNEHSVVLSNSVDESHRKTDDREKSKSDVACTALEKLNNIKFFDRKSEAVANMQPINQPDISLKPTEIRIKNNFETNNKKPKKKKNKKNKYKDIEFYELMAKSSPQRGVDCAFSHVESPHEFYIHIADDESLQIDSITNQLNDMFANTVSEFNSKKNAFDAIGTFCFSLVSSLNSWYRAQVLNWELESKSDDVLVQFVDYGDKKRISYKNLRRMTKEMAEIPMLAVRCHLALMYPPQSTYTDRLTEWPAATIDALMNLSGLLTLEENDRDKIFRIVYANQEENSVSIDLYNLQDHEEHTVGQVLLDLNLAVQITDGYDEENPELDVFLQDVNTLERADNINEAVMGYDPRDEVRICRFTKSDGTCYKGKNCKLEHIPLSKDGFTTDTEPIFKEAMYGLALPAKGTFVNILITAYKDVCNFFAQIIWKPHREKNYMIDEDLYALLADMNMTKTVRTYETFKISPAIGEIVIVRHWSNKCLRAVVREEIMENDGQLKYKVFTLDFGEYITVPLDGLRKIKPHFLELPFQAVHCYLHNKVANEDCDKKKAKEFFIEKLYYHNFVAHTMSASLPLKMAVTTFDSRDIGRMLIERNFAKEWVCDFNLIDNDYMDLF